MEGLVELFGGLLAVMIVIWIVILVVSIIFYVIISKWLSKFNTLLYGTGTWMAWVPGFQVYLLGKLAVNKLAGIILAVVGLLNGLTVGEKAVLPSWIALAYTVAEIVILIIGIEKYNKIKRGELDVSAERARAESMSFGNNNSGTSAPPFDGAGSVNPNPPVNQPVNPGPVPGGKFCPNCGASQNAEAKFCTSCGQQL